MFQPPAVADLALDLLRDLKASREQRFRWIQQAHDDFYAYASRMSRWEQKVGDLVRGLKERGWGKQADELIGQHLSRIRR